MQSAKREQKFLDIEIDESRYFSTALNRKRAKIPRDSEKDESRYLHSVSRKRAEIPPDTEQDESSYFSMQLAKREQNFLHTVSRDFTIQ